MKTHKASISQTSIGASWKPCFPRFPSSSSNSTSPSSSSSSSSSSSISPEPTSPNEIPVYVNCENQLTLSSPHPLVDYVLLAEFDIDTGSTLRHQYPSPIPGYKADWFAEHMLPEGSHNRDLDFTYIFLNREGKHENFYRWVTPKSYEDKLNSKLKKNINTTSKDSKETNQEGSPEETFFLYGLNCVKTKFDSSLRRGARMAACCVFSRSHYLETFRKPLERALEAYFNHPQLPSPPFSHLEIILKNLYESLNNIEGWAELPRPDFLERRLMRRGVIFDPLRPVLSDHHSQSWNSHLVYHSPELFTEFSTAESGKYYSLENEKRSGISFIPPTPLSSITIPLPLYMTPDEVSPVNLSRFIKLFGEQNTMKIYHGLLTKQRILFVGYNHSASDISSIVLSAISLISPPFPNIIRRVFPYATLFDLDFLKVKGYIAGTTNPMIQQNSKWWDILVILDLPNNSITLYNNEETSNITLSSTIPPSSSSGSSSLGSSNIVNAAGSIAEDLVSGIGSGVSKLNLSSGEDAPHYYYDMKFISYVMSGINSRLSEEWVRQQFFDYTHSLILHCQDRQLPLNYTRIDEKTRKFLDANTYRLSVIEQTEEFQYIPPNPWCWARDRDHLLHQYALLDFKKGEKEIVNDISEGANTESSISNIEDDYQLPLDSSNSSSKNNEEEVNLTFMKNFIRKLTLESPLETTILDMYFTHLDHNLHTEAELQALLVLLPESQGGLMPIALGLYSKSPLVKLSATRILQRIGTYPSTRCALLCLNEMIKLTFSRMLSRVNDGSLVKESEEYKRNIQLIQKQKVQQNNIKNSYISSTSINQQQNKSPSAITSKHNISSNNNSNNVSPNAISSENNENDNDAVDISLPSLSTILNFIGLEEETNSSQ